MPRVQGDKARRGISMLDVAFSKIDRLDGRLRGSMWPNPKWQKDPVGFVREVLREPVIFPWQAEILEAIRDHKRVSVRSGQKCCKTTTLAWAALWFYCSYPEATVVINASKGDQIRTVVWKQVLKTLQQAEKRGFALPEVVSENPATGIRCRDGRMIYGLTAREVSSAAGISAAHILFVVDEASALKSNFADAIEGNTAGGDCRILYISNPIETEGPFYDSHHSDKGRWRTFHLSSEKVAQFCETNGIRMPGVAHGDTIREWESFYGRDSQFFLNRALGEFVLAETGRVVSVATILAAQQRECRPTGTLRIGVDPAGDGDAGDEWGFAVVRGPVCLRVYRRRGLTVEAGVAEVEGLLAEFREGEEHPHVNVDAEGAIGTEYAARLKALSGHYGIHSPRLGFEAFSVRSGKPATREPNLYSLTRDEMWSNAALWLRSGSIPVDIYLEVELHAPFFTGIQNPRFPGRVTCTPKKELRKKLGRSPDTADAFVLAVWDATPWHVETAIAEGRRQEPVAEPRRATLPDNWEYEGDVYGGRIDPYK